MVCLCTHTLSHTHTHAHSSLSHTFIHAHALIHIPSHPTHFSLLSKLEIATGPAVQMFIGGASWGPDCFSLGSLFRKSSCLSSVINQLYPSCPGINVSTWIPYACFKMGRMATFDFDDLFIRKGLSNWLVNSTCNSELLKSLIERAPTQV